MKWEKMLETHDDDGKAFLKSLKVGDIVHYHNAFNQFLRLQVTKAGVKPYLKAIAMVGDWRKHDLPYRDEFGDTHYGYHTDFIRTGKSYECNPSNFYEHSDRKDMKDPRHMVPLNITIPPRTAQEQASADKWMMVRSLQKALERKGEESPDDIIDRVFALAQDCALDKMKLPC